MTNLVKSDSSTVDIDGQWYGDQLFITLTRNSEDTGTSNFKFALDDIDLEHFICVLIELQR